MAEKVWTLEGQDVTVPNFVEIDLMDAQTS